MKDDPVYASAVGRLRVRDCNLGDVELFNSRVVKSAKHPDGLSMAGDRENATMLVGTNFIRELLNNTKARSSAERELIYCAACDLIDGSEPPPDERKHLLTLNLADFSSEGALPGLIPLYVGMPVILRNRNISTELGITNGAQGVVRRVFTKPCVSNYSVAQCVIVEFPDSNAEIPGLPPRHFPIVPTTWKFSMTIADPTGRKRNVSVVRSQLNLQPAFAITGHAAQGKTLPQVLVNLREGGFAAYVSASRARMREGLFLSEAVSLDDLNRPVSSDLRHECRRLERLEHNTKICHGFETGPIMPALDPESEADVSGVGAPGSPFAATTSMDQRWSPPDAKPTAPSVGALNPRSAAPMSLNRSWSSPGTSVLAAPSRPISDSPDHHNGLSSPAGCPWSANSCAYDTFFMTMFAVYRDAADAWKQAFRTMGPWFEFLVVRFEYLTAPTNFTDPRSYAKCRDDLRDLLSEHDPLIFPRTGERHTSIYRVFGAFEENCSRSTTLVQRFSCSAGCSVEHDAIYLPNACNTGNWVNGARRADFSYTRGEASIQLFVDLQIGVKISQGLRSRCERCSGPRTSTILLPNPSPWLFFSLLPYTRPCPQPLPTLEIRGETGIMTYRLYAVIYYNGTHFTAVWANKDGSYWGYDGLARGGRPERLHSAGSAASRAHAGYDAHIALYGLG